MVWTRDCVRERESGPTWVWKLTLLLLPPEDALDLALSPKLPAKLPPTLPLNDRLYPRPCPLPLPLPLPLLNEPLPDEKDTAREPRLPLLTLAPYPLCPE